MSRRPNPAADRAAQNQATLKSLVKLESNKSCADCKRNKHPRWASWNLGIFVCIRCSGIHRGMGTHISRVKSVDLDSWTDEQLQSMLRWGNTRANKSVIIPLPTAQQHTHSILQVLGSEACSWPCACRGQDRELYQDEVRLEAMGHGRPYARSCHARGEW